MKTIVSFVIGALFASQGVFAHAGHHHEGEDYEVLQPPKFADSHVVVLDNDNFDEIIDGSKPALVEFYAPWVINYMT